MSGRGLILANWSHESRVVTVTGLMVLAAGAVGDVSIAPQPKYVQVADGEIILPKPITVVVKDDCVGRDRTAPRQLAAHIQALTGDHPRKTAARRFAEHRPALIVGEAGRNAAVDRVRSQYPGRPEPPADEPEGFAISTGPYGVLVEGNSPAATFYGTQTLMQYLTSRNRQLVCRQITIIDQPDFPLRVAMLGIWGPGAGEVTNMDFPFAKQLIRDLISPSRYNAVLISAKFRYESHPEAGHLYPDVKNDLRELLTTAE